MPNSINEKKNDKKEKKNKKNNNTNKNSKKRLESRKKYISQLLDLVEVVLKNNIFTFEKKTLKQKRETAIGTKFAPPYSILFMAELEEDIIKESEYKPYL